MCAEGLEPLGELGKRKDLGWNLKGRGYMNQARPGGIDRMEGGEEISARRTPQWAYRPPRNVSIPIGRKHIARIERQMGAYNNALYVPIDAQDGGIAVVHLRKQQTIRWQSRA